MNNPTEWILVADEAIARILAPGRGDTLAPVEEIANPDAHLREAQLSRDAGGRRVGGNPQGARVASSARMGATATASAGESERHKVAEDFAREVCKHLTQALQHQRFETLRIVAAPRFLGLLRKHLDAACSARVTATLDSDLVHLSGEDIAAHLRNAAPNAKA